MSTDKGKYESGRTHKWLEYLVFSTLLIGLALRLIVYLQCNSMYIDEANIARNVFERNYHGLTQPLSYYQYAPPVFLWIIKSSTSIFGYSEYAYRIFPLFCGLVSLCLMFVVIKYYAGYKGIWYAILLLALGPIYVRYASATKQYVPDMMVTLILVWLALKNSIESKSGIKLFLIWTIAGSIAIWSSMPSVFILAGVGSYYFSQIISSKNIKKLWFLFVAGAVWLLQFAFYYMLILKPQANTEYLQNFHKDYFFYWPKDTQIFGQDVSLLLSVISTAGGHQVLSLAINIGSILIAIIYLARTQRPKLLLITIPLLAVLFAVGLHQYTLIPRVTLFAMPLLLILIAVGMEQILNIRFMAIRVITIACAVICIANFNALKNFVYPMQEEEMKESLSFLVKKGVIGQQLYVQHLGEPAYAYYTQIHPDKGQWSQLIGASTFVWGENLDSLSNTFTKRSAILYGWDASDNVNIKESVLRKGYVLEDSNKVKGSSVFIYEK